MSAFRPFRRADYGFTPAKIAKVGGSEERTLASWRPPRTSPLRGVRDCLAGVANGSVGCGVRPGSSMLTSA